MAFKDKAARFFREKFRSMIAEGLRKNMKNKGETNYLLYNNLTVHKKLLARFYLYMWKILEIRPNKELSKELRKHNIMMQGRIKDAPKVIEDRSGPRTLN